MTKALSSFPEVQRKGIAVKRAEGNTGGLGQLAAQDYLARQKRKAEAEAKAKAEAVAVALSEV